MDLAWAEQYAVSKGRRGKEKSGENESRVSVFGAGRRVKSKRKRKRKIKRNRKRKRTSLSGVEFWKRVWKKGHRRGTAGHFFGDPEVQQVVFLCCLSVWAETWRVFVPIVSSGSRAAEAASLQR